MIAYHKLRKRKGVAFLIDALLGCLILILTANMWAASASGRFATLDASRTASITEQLARVKAKEIEITPYSSASTLAAARAAVSDTSYEREVIVGSEVDLGGGNKKRDITVNVYKPGETVPRFSLPVTLTSQSSVTNSNGGRIKWDTPGTYKWKVPNVTTVYVSMSGGGGGGGIGYIYDGIIYPGGGGGGAAAVMAQPVNVTPGEEISITIGQGGLGASGASPNSPSGRTGEDGGTTYFGSYLSCAGGKGGKSETGGVAGGSGGSPGEKGYSNHSPGQIRVGRGGSSLFGVGGMETSSVGYGAGGSGKGTVTITERAFPGTNGFVLVEW